MDASEVETVSMRTRGFLFDDPSLSRLAGAGVGVEVQLGTTRSYMDDPPVRVRVAGYDRQWVGGTFDWVASELAKNVPWWSFLRRPISGILIGLLIGLGIAGAVMSAVKDSPETTRAGLISFGVVLVLAAMAFGRIAIAPLLKKLFPAVEVIEAGATPKGHQTV